MRDLRALNPYRYRAAELAKREHLGLPPPTEADLRFEGVFVMISATDPAAQLNIIASNGAKWDHVSVSTEDRCPSWAEMEQVKRLFFRDDEVAMQLHVAPADHINVHPFVLHLWRPHGRHIPLPPKWMVA